MPKIPTKEISQFNEKRSNKNHIIGCTKSHFNKLSKATHGVNNYRIRATIILYAADEMANAHIAEALNITRGMVITWRNRWFKISALLNQIEIDDPSHLKKEIEKALNGEYRFPEEFEQKVKIICDLYQNAPQYESQNIHLLSVDEKTGIQALEHIDPPKPMRPGSVEKIEQEYTRNGTTGIITSINIAICEIIAPLIQETRNEMDFTEHIIAAIERAPQDQYIFILDQLNTHKSETLVRFIAQREGINETELGEKGKNGILENMETRDHF
jgi:hypothetical protein